VKRCTNATAREKDEENVSGFCGLAESKIRRAGTQINIKLPSLGRHKCHRLLSFFKANKHAEDRLIYGPLCQELRSAWGGDRNVYEALPFQCRSRAIGANNE
jgi:hypothetical protein